MGDLISFFSSAGLRPLFEKLLELRGTRRSEIEKLGDIFGDPVELAKYYVEPNCQHHNPADYDESEPISYVRSPVFRTLNDFFNRGAFSVRDGRNQMFVLSDAGLGKTSLLVMLHLSCLTAFWPREFRSVLLKLGPSTLSDIKALGSRRKKILLLDALDEDSDSWGRVEDRIGELLNATSNFFRVVISCRTQFFPHCESGPFGSLGRVEVAGFTCPMIYLSLFDENQVDLYLEKRFPGQGFRIGQIDSNESPSTKKILELMGSLRFRPLLLAHIEDLLSSEIAARDEYSIFKALCESWLLREERKLRRMGESPSPTKEELWEACEAIALLMQLQGARSLPEDQVYGVAGGSRLARLDVGGRSLLNRTSDGDFRFSHFSIQEFFVAHVLGRGKVESPISKGSIPASGLIVEFLRRKKWLKKALPHLDLKGVHLDGVPLRKARLNEKSLLGIGLEKSDLSGSDLSWSSLVGASLAGADFSRAKASRTSFNRADLRGAHFIDTDLRHASFCDADLQGACFVGAVLEGSQFDRAQLKATFFTSRVVANRLSSWSGLRLVPDLALHPFDEEIIEGWRLGSAPRVAPTRGRVEGIISEHKLGVSPVVLMNALLHRTYDVLPRRLPGEARDRLLQFLENIRSDSRGLG